MIDKVLKEHLPLFVVTAFACLIGLGFQLSIDLKGETVFAPQFLGEFFTVFIWAPFVIVFLKSALSFASGKPQPPTVFAATIFSPFSMLRVFVCFICIYLVIVVFGSVKSLIGLVLTPHGHDYLFIAIEKFIHGGRLPHEYFGFVFENSTWLYSIDFLYGLWFFLMYVILAGIVFQPPGTPGRMQYIVSFCLCWTIIGNVLAALGASAGPIFWEYYLPDPNPYESLLATLDQLEGERNMFCTRFRDAMLYMMHNDRLVDMNGPAALPSVHVAMATLFTLYSWKYCRVLFIPTLIYLVIIQLGSFLLSWHYALDGYVGAAAMVAIWLVVGRYVENKGADRQSG